MCYNEIMPLYLTPEETYAGTAANLTVQARLS